MHEISVDWVVSVRRIMDLFLSLCVYVSLCLSVSVCVCVCVCVDVWMYCCSSFHASHLDTNRSDSMADARILPIFVSFGPFLTSASG
jgi:hypothetical protein